MTVEAWAMIGAGVAALLVGVALAPERFRHASGAARVLVLAPILEAAALAAFAAEHFTAAHDLLPIVPHWLPIRMFWVYFVGAALLAAAVSLVAWRHVRWSSGLLAVLFLTIVITIDVPGVPKGAHNRIFWILFVREISFAGGAAVLCGSLWTSGKFAGAALVRAGRSIVALIMLFYAVEHFLFPRNVPGVPLEMMTPAWMPVPVLIADLVGVALLLGGIGLLIPRTVRIAAAAAGVVLTLLTVFFYGPIFLSEMHTPLAVEGLNYIFDTLLFAATVMLAGYGGAGSPEPAEAKVPALAEEAQSAATALRGRR